MTATRSMRRKACRLTRRLGCQEEEPLEPGEAFPLVNKLLRLNESLPADAQVEVVLLSRNSADTGLRVFNSIQHYKLDISRAAFCGGESPWRYINAFRCKLFLSNEAQDVRHALECGVAAATLVSRSGGGTTASSCALPLTAMLSCFPMKRSRSNKRDGLEAFPPVRKQPPGSRSGEGRSNPSCLRCIACNRPFPRRPRPSEQPW